MWDTTAQRTEWTYRGLSFTTWQKSWNETAQPGMLQASTVTQEEKRIRDREKASPACVLRVPFPEGDIQNVHWSSLLHSGFLENSEAEDKGWRPLMGVLVLDEVVQMAKRSIGG
ncbi:hypothetical protein P7K49_000162 [Saguinus oedipus]|uniref:Uncharacterized protein n=1 Tax=Saguinus oedipus TaxID=9490 RepID=A0ABQ9WBQ2_SAGOE|nr:hypothetical protein P7K49_000162 [Saguinus oedipus]